MPRKRTGDILTGGTHDVNPQFLTFSVAQSVNDTTVEKQYQVPVPRFSQEGGRAIVMEVLRVWFKFNPFQTIGAGLTFQSITGTITTKSHGGAGVDYGSTDIVWQNGKNMYAAFTAAGSAIAVNNQTVEVQDLTDSAGHGLIVATDNIFVTIESAATSAKNYIEGKIEYRFKEVSLAEYIGIVQSQQN